MPTNVIAAAEELIASYPDNGFVQAEVMETHGLTEEEFQAAYDIALEELGLS